MRVLNKLTTAKYISFMVVDSVVQIKDFVNMSVMNSSEREVAWNFYGVVYMLI